MASAASAQAAGGAAALAPGWLMRQAELGAAQMLGEVPRDTRHWQADIGGVRRAEATREQRLDAPLLPMVMSAILPGAGEIYLGRKRGFLMAALDVASWWRMAHNAKEGRDKRDEYYVFADAHWSEERLKAAYDPNYLSYGNPAYSYWEGRGTEYFSVTGYENLPLWVSVVDDRREYYENLGKWDQFVFGWEDFRDPRDFLGLSPQERDIANLKDPRTSALREQYRQLRQDSNDAFARRDRYLYLSIGLRVFSVLQVAYLEGLLTGDGGGRAAGASGGLQLGGHSVEFIVEPAGPTRGLIAAAVSF